MTIPPLLTCLLIRSQGAVTVYNKVLRPMTAQLHPKTSAAPVSGTSTGINHPQ